MIDVSAVATASVVCLLGVMSPGPNFVAVSHRAVVGTRSEALALVGGVALVSFLWASAALFGLGLLVGLWPFLFWGIKAGGAAYLVWFGLTLMRRASVPLPPDTAAPDRTSFLRAFRDGIVTNLSNPKAVAFYASVFSAGVPRGAGTATLAALAAMVPVIAATWYGSVALFLSTDRAAAVYRRGKPIIERSCGAFLVLLGLRQVLGRA